jgi:hypothetical protein
MYSSISENEPSVAGLDILTISNRLRLSMRSNLPSFLRGWHFLSVVASDDAEALCIKASPNADGPTIIFNPTFVNPDFLEDPAAALLWLPIALNHLCTEMLLESDDDGLFASSRWAEFRSVACSHMCMEWNEILSSTDRLGTTYMAEALASALLVESGLMDILISRRDSRTEMLKSA